MRNRQIVALVLTFGLMVGVAQAQTRTIHRLGGPTRMTNAVYTTEGVAQAFSPIQADVKTVLTKAGLPALGDRIAARLAAGNVVRTTLPKDTHLEWMAMRGKNGVDITRDIKWSGSALPGYEFIEHEGDLDYVFFVPEICGNVSLVRTAVFVPAKSVTTPPITVQAAQPAPPAAPPVVIVLTPEPEQEPEPAPVPEKAEYRYSVTGFGGRQVRQYGSSDPAHETPAGSTEAYHEGLVGVKLGGELGIGRGWTFAPAIGVAYNTGEHERSVVFADVMAAHAIGSVTLSGGVTGAENTGRDPHHADSFVIGYVGAAALPVSDRLAVVVDWRQYAQPLFGQFTDPDINFQFGAGMRVSF